MRFCKALFYVTLFSITVLNNTVRSDTTCGGGALQALVGGSAECIDCGNASALASATGYSATCLSSVGSTYCQPTDSDGQCNVCPAGTHAASPTAAAIGDCVCDAGTFGLYSNCSTCTVGYFCPGDGVRHQCTGGHVTEPREGQTASSACQSPVCGNGKREPGEDCDDGEQYSGDGCRGDCTYEDPGGVAQGSVWFCYDDDPLDIFSGTSCCATLTNPVTQTITCSCAAQASDDIGYEVLSTCEKRDINECNTGNGGCAEQAACTNLDGVLRNGTHTCTCPRPMLGDGVVRCDMFVFATHIVFELVGLTLAELNLQELANIMVNESVFPGKAVVDIELSATPYKDAALERNESELGVPLYQQQRRLLQQQPPDYGVHLKVIVLSQDALAMENTTDAVDVNGLSKLLADWYHVAVNVLNNPANVVEAVDNVYGAVNTVITGFRVEGIVYNKTTQEWLVAVNYVPNSANTITSLYVTKAGDPPYAQNVLDTYYVAKHPCMTTSSVCCLNDYAADYYIGTFASNISSSIGSCTPPVSTSDTLGLFSVDYNEQVLLHALDGLEHSYVSRLSPTRLQLHIHRFALRNQIAVRENVAGGYNMRFFVGMSYYTLLPAAAMATVASQSAVNVVSTDAVTFATTSEIGYTFIEYITLSLYQTIFIEDLVVQHKMQFIKVGFVVPESMKQNMDTGIVPLTSIRFAISRDTPEPLNDPAWVNPCFSSDNSGLYDNSTSSLRALYTRAEYQTCAYQTMFCVNPETEILPTGFVEIWLPIGDDTITQAMLDDADAYTLFVYFDVSVRLASGKTSITKLFAMAPITALSFARACEEVAAAQTVADVVELDLNVGMVGLEKDWDGSITKFTNLIQQSATGNYEDTMLDVSAVSLQSGLITLAIRGNDAMFNNPVAMPFHMEIDDLLTMHFLDDTKYNDMVALLDSSTAWEMVRDEGTGYLEIAMTTSALDVCTAEVIPGDFTCALRKNIYRRQVVWDYGVHALATGVNTNNESHTVAWLQEHLLGESEFAANFARNFTRLVREKHKINDRYNKAWYVNPSYAWPVGSADGAQAILSLSDKMIMVGIISLEDENWAYGSGTGVGVRRMLLQGTYDGQQVRTTVRALRNSPVVRPMPAIHNAAIENDKEVARMLGMEGGQWLKLRLKMNLQANSHLDKHAVRNEIETRLRRNSPLFLTSTPKDLRVVQFLMHSTRTGIQSRRLSTHRDVLDWDGYVNVMLDLGEANNAGETADTTLYYNWLRCALFLGNITSDRSGASSAACGSAAATDDTMVGFIEAFWIETCANYSHTGTNCSQILLQMDAPPTFTPRPLQLLTAEEANIRGYELYILLTNSGVTVQTFTAFEEGIIRSIIADNFNVPVSRTQFDGAGANAPEARRRLLAVWLSFTVWLRADYNVALLVLADLKQQIADDIFAQLGYTADVSQMRIEPIEGSHSGATPAEKRGSDDSEDDASRMTVIIILVSTIGGVLVLTVFGCVFFWAVNNMNTVTVMQMGTESTVSGPAVQRMQSQLQTEAATQRMQRQMQTSQARTFAAESYAPPRRASLQPMRAGGGGNVRVGYAPSAATNSHFAVPCVGGHAYSPIPQW